MNVTFCGFYIGMTQHVLYYVNRSACCQCVGAGHMPKSMDSDVWEPNCFNVPLKPIVEGVRGHWVN